VGHQFPQESGCVFTDHLAGGRMRSRVNHESLLCGL